MSLKLTDFSFHCSQLFGNSGDCEVEINHCHLHHPCLVSSAGPRIQWLPFLNVWPDGSLPRKWSYTTWATFGFSVFQWRRSCTFFFKCNRNIIDIKRFLHLMTRTQKHLYRQNITVLSRHIIWNIQIWDLQQCDHIFVKSWCFTEILQEKCRKLQKRSVGSKRL